MNTARLQQILNQVRQELLDGPDLPLTPAQINNGWCADFATGVFEEMQDPELEILSDEDLGAEEYSHTFLRYGDLYYDAECIEGTDDWTQLPVFSRPDQLCTRCHRTVAEYSTKDGELCEECWLANS